MRTLFITGAAGYVGEMLCEQFSEREDVRLIVALDRQPIPDSIRGNSKIVYIEKNLADAGWEEDVAKYEPDTVIHTAWQIRAMYGKEKEQWRWNIGGSNKLFDLALSLPSVKKLVHFSTAASYSAREDNTFDHYFEESEGLRADDYIYALEKKTAEENLNAKYESAKRAGHTLPVVTILRPAAITGPRGRYMKIRFGLQSALQGNLKGGIINRLVTLLTSYVPATKGWVRQFVHEDDVTDAVAHFVFTEGSEGIEAYNLTPTGEPVYAPDMAEAVGKKVVPIKPWMARSSFFAFWHLTRGRIPTCPGSWRFYSYPILMSGDKLARVYSCRFDSKDAFRYTDGRYESYVPVALKKSKPQ